METIPLHPMLVHLPIALGVLMPLVAAGALAAWSRGWLPRRAWIAAVLLQALLVGSGVAALRSGERDEERAEQIVPEPAIEAHEAAASLFVAGAGLVLAIASAAAFARNERAARGLAAVATAGTLAVLALGYRTGEAGGRLVYAHGAAAAFAARDAGIAGAEPGARELAEDDD